METSRMIEALLFASEAPLSAVDLARVEDSLDEDQVEAIVAELRQEYDKESRAFGIFEIAGGFQILTRPEFAFVLERYETVPTSSRLSTAALETLAIVSFRQPVGRAEVEEIRGVGAGGVLKTLLEREMIEVVGRGEGLGRPLLYGTTRQFLEHFGFRGLDELPRSEELEVVLATREARALAEEQESDEDEALQLGLDDEADEPVPDGRATTNPRAASDHAASDETDAPGDDEE